MTAASTGGAGIELALVATRRQHPRVGIVAQVL
jgi:hypothetical protein